MANMYMCCEWRLQYGRGKGRQVVVPTIRTQDPGLQNMALDAACLPLMSLKLTSLLLPGAFTWDHCA